MHYCNLKGLTLKFFRECQDPQILKKIVRIWEIFREKAVRIKLKDM